VIQGGKETLYPEFRLKIQQMIKDAAARGARPGSR
jgi:hypothetical protein